MDNLTAVNISHALEETTTNVTLTVKALTLTVVVVEKLARVVDTLNAEDLTEVANNS